ncbi:hypothetical protein BN1708_001940 [Verticillium longisporum]|uniref:Uncharacterized protein n=1 Tax=Verticillium longisporum TaxID=100787 RepID=A0A0G4KDB1_VERLO|nr:hypothetical protein BN1708_001940 [Verticillium longisporum]
MCKWVKYTQKFRSYRENYTVTMRDVTESVSLKGSCPECPSGSK